VAAFVCLVLPHSVAANPIAWFAFWVESWPLSVTGEPYVTVVVLAARVNVTGGAAPAAAARAAPTTAVMTTVLIIQASRRPESSNLAACYDSPMRALVTGGVGRVGEAIVRRLERDGWSVFAAGRADGDVSRPEEARALVQRAAEELGGLDLLVNAAGEGFAPKPFDELDERDWDAAFGATAKGSFFVTQAAAPALREARGCVVMIEDVAGYQPWPSFAAHSAAKAAQAMLTRVLARALAPEVRVCGIAPGPVAIERGQEERRAAETLLGRIGSPDDVADAVVYLAGASFVTGTTLVVDGGRSLQSGAAPQP
jgi:pteridine reductase